MTARSNSGSAGPPLQELHELLERVAALETLMGQLVDRAESERRLLEEWASAIASSQLELAALSSWRSEITSAVAEGIQRVDRSERRIKATVRRAKRQLEAFGIEDEGLDAEARDVGLDDDDRGGARRLPPVPEVVADPDEGPSSVPGVSAGQLRRARGF